MKILSNWSFKNTYTPTAMLKEPGRIVKVDKIRCINPGIDLNKLRDHNLVLITGDGCTLPNESRAFEAWNVPHDLYCINRSLIFFERQVDHWAAIDVEEAVWFSRNVTGKICPNKPIMRHTIGEGRQMYDIWWERIFNFENDYQRRVWIGNTGFFGILTAIEMGYKKIVLAGMPLDNKNHWYQHEDTPGPVWNPLCLEQWSDFKVNLNGNCNIRSMGGRTAEIFGLATKEWAE